MDKYKFGEFLYKKRKSLGLTQDELGRKLGVTNKAVSKWEVGETFPDVTMLKPLGDILGITVDELLTQKEIKVEEKKKRRTSLALLIVVIVLVLLEGLTILSFSGILLGGYISRKTDENTKIEVNTENHDDYISIIPMKNFISDDQNLTIDSFCKLDTSYSIEDEVTMIIEYDVDVFYYLADNTIGGISYYNRVIEFTLTKELSEGGVSIDLSPNNQIENLRGIKSIIINYKVISCNGSVTQVKE